MPDLVELTLPDNSGKPPIRDGDIGHISLMAQVSRGTRHRSARTSATSVDVSAGQGPGRLSKHRARPEDSNPQPSDP